MELWTNENLFVFILAIFSGFELVKRFSVRLYAALVGLPLRCYFGIMKNFAIGKPRGLTPCQEGGRHHSGTSP